MNRKLKLLRNQMDWWSWIAIGKLQRAKRETGYYKIKLREEAEQCKKMIEKLQKEFNNLRPKSHFET